jgi:uncharacterized protein (TIGR00251 family)
MTSSPSAAWYRWEGHDLIVLLRVQPRASQNELVGPRSERLQVRITAAPVEGKANAHLRKFLADTFRVSPSSITLISGETVRDKCVRIHAPRRLPPGITPPATKGGCPA